MADLLCCICGTRITGLSGLQEANNLLRHINRRHTKEVPGILAATQRVGPDRRYTLSDALEFRITCEEAMEAIS